jgi:hypothetical protein
MKGTILDFLKLAAEKPELVRELGQLAAKYDFEFTLPDEVSDEQLEGVAGGSEISEKSLWMSDLSAGALMYHSITEMARSSQRDMQEAKDLKRAASTSTSQTKGTSP